MIRNRILLYCIALASGFSFTVNLVGSDQPVPSTVIGIIAGYAAEATSIVIPTSETMGKLEPDYYDVTFQDDDQLKITELHINGHDVTVYSTPYTKQKSRGFWNSSLGYIKGQTTRTDRHSDRDLSVWDNKNDFIDEFRRRNQQNVPWHTGTSYQYAQSKFEDKEVRQLITLPARIVNISADNLHSHELAPKIAVSTWRDSTIYSFDPSPRRVHAINNALNARFLYADRARKNNTTTRKALLAGIAIVGAAAAYTGCQSK